MHYVEIPKFDENADINKELKNWILFLKSNKEEDMSQLLKEDTIFEKAMKKYNYFTDNEDLLNEYDKREAYLVYQSSLIRGATEDGRDEERKLIAKNFKKSGLDIKLISENTGLSIEEIEKL